jgi:acyl carrier protein
MTDVRNTLREIMELVLDQDVPELRDDMSAENFPDWDSLAHLNIVVSMEKALGIRFAAAEISRMKQPGQTIGSFLALIAEKMDSGNP